MDLEVGCQIFDYWRGTLCRDLGTGGAQGRRNFSRGGAEVAEKTRNGFVFNWRGTLCRDRGMRGAQGRRNFSRGGAEGAEFRNMISDAGNLWIEI